MFKILLSIAPLWPFVEAGLYQLNTGRPGYCTKETKGLNNFQNGYEFKQYFNINPYQSDGYLSINYPANCNAVTISVEACDYDWYPNINVEILARAPDYATIVRTGTRSGALPVELSVVCSSRYSWDTGYETRQPTPLGAVNVYV